MYLSVTFDYPLRDVFSWWDLDAAFRLMVRRGFRLPAKKFYISLAREQRKNSFFELEVEDFLFLSPRARRFRYRPQRFEPFWTEPVEVQLNQLTGDIISSFLFLQDELPGCPTLPIAALRKAVRHWCEPWASSAEEMLRAYVWLREGRPVLRSEHYGLVWFYTPRRVFPTRNAGSDGSDS